ncbi:hypothetical protein [Planctomicrobium piriforme]|uniref:hypothetical protein n=1 Tax=Planctomicrobium piriforme TaxID=1576369 RepID=UPI0011143021|nr:hypothetical protein [Planctomicrobium piriforme]
MTALFWVGLVAVCWLGMQIVHESGHVLAAWATGGSVVAVDLHPLHISRTDVRPNPWPRVVIWSGPIWGVLTPGVMWLLARRC